MGNWNELYAFSVSFERNWEKKKNLQFVPKLFFFFFLKEHRVRNFDSLCILMRTFREEEAYLYVLVPRYCHDGHHSSDIKGGEDLEVVFSWTILCSGS